MCEPAEELPPDSAHATADGTKRFLATRHKRPSCRGLRLQLQVRLITPYIKSYSSGPRYEKSWKCILHANGLAERDSASCDCYAEWVSRSNVRALGLTGLHISPVGFGCHRLEDVNLRDFLRVPKRAMPKRFHPLAGGCRCSQGSIGAGSLSRMQLCPSPAARATVVGQLNGNWQRWIWLPTIPTVLLKRLGFILVRPLPLQLCAGGRRDFAENAAKPQGPACEHWVADCALLQEFLFSRQICRRCAVMRSLWRQRPLASACACWLNVTDG